MQVLWLLALVFLIVIVWIIWAPLTLCINTYQNQYYFSLGKLLVISPYQGKDGFAVKLRVPFHTFYVNPFKAKSKTQKAKKRKKNTRSKRVDFKMMLALIRTFSIRRFQVDVDTDDYMLNAQLVPIFFGLSQGKMDLRTNFYGKANLWVVVENRLIRFLRVIIKHQLKKYF